MKDYYALLRVSRSASDQEIKQAYRRLAILLHPDKNPHPEAPLGFQEVTEAYEVLGNPLKRSIYDQMMAHEASSAEDFYHRDPAYRPRKRTTYKPPSYEPSAGEILMMKLMPYTIWVNRFCLIVSLLLLIDFLLPPEKNNEIIIRDQRTFDGHIMITDKGNSFGVLFPKNKPFIREPEIIVTTSGIFNFLILIETKSGSYQINNLPSVYTNFKFGPVVLAGLSLLGLFFKEPGEVRFNVALVSLFILFLNLMFFWISVW